MGAQIPREERTPIFTLQLPPEENGAAEEIELGEIRVLSQGHTEG